jgi:hypothetical protein
VLLPRAQLGERDAARLYYPLERGIALALRAGRLPLWEPRIEAGMSFLGQMTPAALHPFALLYLPLPFDLAFKLEHLLALVLGGLGAAWLAAELGATRWAALCAAFAFGGSGALVSTASSNLAFALGPAAAPLGVAGLLRFLRAPTPGRLLAGGAALALTAYGGDPQAFGMAIVAGMSLAVAEGPRLPRAGRTAVWALCALLLAAPVVFPAAAQLARSERGAGLTVAERAAFATAPSRLWGLLVPLAFDAVEPARPEEGDPFKAFFAGGGSTAFLSSITLGAPALLFAAWSMRRLRPRIAVFLALALAAAATGDAIGLQPLLARIIPGWGLFRFPEKLLLHASWLLAAAAGAGVEDAWQGGRRARIVRGAFILCASAVAAFAVVWLGGGAIAASLARAAPSAAADRFVSLLASGLAWTAALSGAVGGIALVGARTRFANAGPALVSGAFAVSALVAPPLRTVSAELYEGKSATGTQLLAAAGPSAGRWRVWADPDQPLLVPEVPNRDDARLFALRETLWPQLQVLDDIDGAAVYSSAPDVHFSAVLRNLPQTAIDLLGIRFYVVPPDGGAPPEAATTRSGLRVIEKPIGPRAFVVHRARPARDLSDAIAMLRGIDVRSEAVLPAGAAEVAGTGAGSPAELRRLSPEEMEVAVASPTPGLLVVAEHFDAGWSAQVDGKRAPVSEADLMVLSVPVPAGSHTVRMRFRPVGLVPGSLCAGATVLVLGGLALRRRRSP